MSYGSVTTPDLMGLVNRELTPEMIHRAALQLGEDDAHTRSALSTSVPSVLTALSDVASSDVGATHLKHVIDQRHGTGNVASALGSSAGRDEGAALFDGEAGERAARIADAVARASGVSRESAHELLGGVTSVAVMALGKNAGNMAPSSLGAMFKEQRGEWVRRLPAPVASLFNGHKVAAVGGRSTAVVAEPAIEVQHPVGGPAIRRVAGPSRRGWLVPLVLLAALVLIAIPLFRGLRRPSQVLQTATRPVPEAVLPRPETVPLPLPNGQTLTVPRGSATYELATFMAGSAPTPQRFTLSPMNFDFGSTQLTPESMKTANEVAAILAAYPTATIRVESHTDNVGTPESNLGLSLARSDAVKSLLAGKGVDDSRVTTAGLGQENPIASNDTEEGRARNRRTDVVVTGR